MSEGRRGRQKERVAARRTGSSHSTRGCCFAEERGAGRKDQNRQACKASLSSGGALSVERVVTDLSGVAVIAAAVYVCALRCVSVFCASSCSIRSGSWPIGPGLHSIVANLLFYLRAVSVRLFADRASQYLSRR